MADQRVAMELKINKCLEIRAGSHWVSLKLSVAAAQTNTPAVQPSGTAN